MPPGRRQDGEYDTEKVPLDRHSEASEEGGEGMPRVPEVQAKEDTEGRTPETIGDTEAEMAIYRDRLPMWVTYLRAV